MLKELFCRIFYILPDRPSYIQIETTNRCNFDCTMCPRKSLNVAYKDMDFELFKETVERLNGVYEINLTGWGEPLLNPDIFEMIKLCKNLGFKTDLTTNGSLMEGSRADKLIEAGINKISFSIDSLKNDNIPGHKILHQIENIEKFSLRDKKPTITIQTTVHKNGLGNILEIIEFAKKIKVKKINLARLDTRFDENLQRPGEKEETIMVKTAIKFGNKNKIRVDFVPYAVGNKFTKLFYRLFKNLLHGKGKYCLKTYNYMYVNVDGCFTPCCALPNYRIGDATKDDLKNVWQGENMENFRKKQKTICGDCDVAQIKQNK